MTIRLLGTGGADGVPAFFGDDRVSRYALEHGGKDIRTRSAALIDGELKLDFGPDTLAQVHRDRLNPRDWSAILFTHSDSDHLSVAELQYALFPFNDDTFPGFAIFGNERVLTKIRDRYPDWPFELHLTRSFCPFDHAGYRITPVRANHACGEDAHNLLIERDGVCFLYATDTGIWYEDTWHFLSERKLDGMVIECTEGESPTNYWGHLDWKECLDVVERLRGMGTLAAGAPVVTTHHAASGGLIHTELEALLNPHGIQVGYDGLELGLGG